VATALRTISARGRHEPSTRWKRLAHSRCEARYPRRHELSVTTDEWRRAAPPPPMGPTTTPAGRHRRRRTNRAGCLHRGGIDLNGSPSARFSCRVGPAWPRTPSLGLRCRDNHVVASASRSATERPAAAVHGLASSIEDIQGGSGGPDRPATTHWRAKEQELDPSASAPRFLRDCRISLRVRDRPGRLFLLRAGRGCGRSQWPCCLAMTAAPAGCQLFARRQRRGNRCRVTASSCSPHAHLGVLQAPIPRNMALNFSPGAGSHRHPARSALRVRTRCQVEMPSISQSRTAWAAVFRNP